VTLPIGDLETSSVTGLSDGGWVVTWAAKMAVMDGSGLGVFQQRYGADGSPVTGEPELVNTTLANDQTAPSVARLADGGWVVTWESFGQDNNGYEVYQRVFKTDGSSTGEILVNLTTAGDQSNSSVTGLSDGGWVVTWASDGQDGNSKGVYQQRYDSSGKAVGGETRVNSYTTGDQRSPDVMALVDGGWVVTWQSANQDDGSSYGVFQQRFNKSGAKIGGEMLVNAETDDDQRYPTTAALP
jgi:hypothetical protein